VYSHPSSRCHSYLFFILPSRHTPPFTSGSLPRRTNIGWIRSFKGYLPTPKKIFLRPFFCSRDFFCGRPYLQIECAPLFPLPVGPFQFLLLPGVSRLTFHLFSLSATPSALFVVDFRYIMKHPVLKLIRLRLLSLR